jgi:hypothetical protein
MVNLNIKKNLKLNRFIKLKKNVKINMIHLLLLLQIIKNLFPLNF